VTANPSNGLILRIAVEIVAAAVTAFVLVAFVAPMLMNIRNNFTFWTGVGCWPLAAAVLLSAAALVRRDLRVLRRHKGVKVRLVRPE
jgi:hypothetical protein